MAVGIRRAAARIGALGALLGLGGCLTLSTSGDPGENTFGNLISGNATRAVARTNPVGGPQVKVDCPIVQVADGQSSHRVYNGADRSSANVRYQFSLGDISRECVGTPDGRIQIRIGVAGHVLAGPAGASGSFTVPVRVTIRNEKTQTTAASKVYRIAAAIPPGESQGEFTTVTETLEVPYLSAEADEDYSIYVGLEGAAPRKRDVRSAGAAAADGARIMC